MRTLCTLGLLAILALGCAKKAPPPLVAPPNPNGGGLNTGQPGDNAAVQGSVAPPPLYQGQPVQHWQGQLEQRGNPAARAEASRALGQMGKDGYPVLREGLSSRSAETRLLCLQAMPYPMLMANDKDMCQQVGRMLTDPDPGVRKGAIVRIVWFGKQAGRYRDRLVALRDGDPDGEVRHVAEEGVYLLDKAIRGETARPPGK